MCFGLLWTDVADEVCMGDLVILGDLGLLDEQRGAGAFDLLCRRSSDAKTVFEQSSPLVG